MIYRCAYLFIFFHFFFLFFKFEHVFSTLPLFSLLARCLHFSGIVSIAFFLTFHFDDSNLTTEAFVWHAKDKALKDKVKKKKKN